MTTTFVNRAKVNVLTTGAGTIQLGTALPGFQTLAAAGVTDGQTVRYTIEDGTAWEIGLGVYASYGPALTRTLTMSSTGALLNLTGRAILFVTLAAEDLAGLGGGGGGGGGAGVTDGDKGDVIVSGGGLIWSLDYAAVNAAIAPSWTAVTGKPSVFISDADYGDITVSGLGTVWTVDAKAITLAKMADLSANSIIGNNTGSPATPIALTPAQVAAMLAQSPRTIPLTSDTPTIADTGGYLRTTNASDTAITIPPNASVAFPIGTAMVIEQTNTGIVTISPGAGVTLNTPRGYFTIATQFGVAQIKKVGTDEWTLLGDVGDPFAVGGYATYYGVLKSTYNLANTTAVQQIFNFTTNGALTLPQGTYKFSCMVTINGMSTTNGNADFDFKGAGTATLTRVSMQSIGKETTSGFAAASAVSGGSWATPSTAGGSFITNNTLSGMSALIEGTFDITVSGTIVPSVALATAIGTAQVQVGSYFECTRLGSTGTLSSGWS
jgi:hypothetical protein